MIGSCLRLDESLPFVVVHVLRTVSHRAAHFQELLPTIPGVAAARTSGHLAVVTTGHFDPAMVALYQDAGATVHAADCMTLEEIFVANVQHRRDGLAA